MLGAGGPANVRRADGPGGAAARDGHRVSIGTQGGVGSGPAGGA